MCVSGIQPLSTTKLHRSAHQCPRYAVNAALRSVMYVYYCSTPVRWLMLCMQVFDEFEEWHLIQEHYCISVGLKGCSQELMDKLTFGAQGCVTG